MYLNVDDSGPGGAGAAEARLTGMQTASGIGAGSGYFPTAAQMALGSIGAVICRKSATNNSTARNWVLVADDTVFYLWVETGDYANPVMPTFCMFGDFFSMNGTSDAYRCAIIGRTNENQNNSAYDYFGIHNMPLNQNTGNTFTQIQGGHFVAANSFGVGGSTLFGKHIDVAKAGYSPAGSPVTNNPGTNPSYNLFGGSGMGSPLGTNYLYPAQMMPFPNPVDGGVYMSPIWIHHSGVLRGYFKGLWAPLHHMPLGHGDTFSGSGAFSGKSFLCQMIQGYYSNNNVAGEVFVETSSTWS